MLRVVFLLLLFANLAFFVWAMGYLGGPNAGREPERLREQLQPERLRVARPVEDRSAVATAAEPAQSGEPKPEAICRRIGPLGAAEAEKLKSSLSAQGASTLSVAADEVGYWVFIPPNAGKTPEKTAAELKQFGVTDFFVVIESGADRGAISLGLFRKEDMAKDFLQQLTKKGVRSAKIAQKTRKSDKFRLDVQGDARVLEPLLKGLPFEAMDCPRE